MSKYSTGSVCDDCLRYGFQNYLKPFYINLEEQIIKCESTRCMFPYMRKPVVDPFPDLKLSENIISLDKFIEESAKQIDGSPVKLEPTKCLDKVDEVPIMFDFSSLFMNSPVNEEEKAKPIAGASISTSNNSSKSEDIKSKAPTKKEEFSSLPSQLPPKARISRCLSNVKSTKKLNLKRSKQAKQAKNDTVLVIEPQSGKPMRPLDLIKHYMTNYK